MTNSTILCLEIKAKCTVQIFNDYTKKNLISWIALRYFFLNSTEADITETNKCLIYFFIFLFPNYYLSKF